MSTKMETNKRINQKSMPRKIRLEITSRKITRTRRRLRKKNRGRRSITIPCTIVQVQSRILQIAYQTPRWVTAIPESSSSKHYKKFKTCNHKLPQRPLCQTNWIVKSFILCRFAQHPKRDEVILYKVLAAKGKIFEACSLSCAHVKKAMLEDFYQLFKNWKLVLC